jgi:hypothetical protein
MSLKDPKALTVNTIYLPDTNQILAAKASVDLWAEEIKRAQEGKKQAELQLCSLLAQELDHTALKPIEGDIIKISNYDNLLYFYAEGAWRAFPLAEDL